MSYFIRRAEPRDALGIHTAHMKSILEICAKDHTEAQLNAWGRRPYSEERRLESMRQDKVWVVELNGIVEGYGHAGFSVQNNQLEGHLYGLYITPAVLGGGVGKRLFDNVVEEMKSANVKRFEFSSTITSEKFYKKMGCREIPGNRTMRFKGATEDQPIIPMEYWVSDAPPYLRLEKPTLLHCESFIKAMKHYKEKDGLYKEFDIQAFEKNPLPYIQECQTKDVDPPKGKVPDLYFWAIENDEYVGRISLRLQLNDFLKKIGGHVGYEVAPWARQRGVAAEMLRLLKLTPEAQDIRSLLITCDEDNAASEKVILTNGGYLKSGRVFFEPENKNLKHFILNTTIYPQVESRRLIMNRVMNEDVSSIFEYASSKNVAEFVTWDAHETLDDSRDFLSFIGNSSIDSSERSNFVFAIRLRENQKMIGTIQFSRYGQSGQVDFALHDKYWNQGIMTEAVAAIVKWSFKRYPQLNRIQSYHLPQNIGSGKVMEKVGLKTEGVLRSYVQWKGLSADIVMHSIIRGDHLKDF